MQAPDGPPTLDERHQWELERARLEEKIRKDHEESKRTLRLFKMMQTTLEEQQKVLDRYQKTLQAHGLTLLPVDQERDEIKRDTANAVDDQCHGSSPEKKRLKTTSPVAPKRYSLSTVHDQMRADATLRRSPERRRSFPEHGDRVAERRTNDAGKSSNTNMIDSWRARKKDMHINGGRRFRATELPRQRQPREPTGTLRNPQPTRMKASHEALPDSVDRFLDNDDFVPEDSRVENQPETKPTEQRSRMAAQKQPLQQRDAKPSIKISASATSSNANRIAEKENTFAFVEVVRNRAERAALPGHDCVECRKYYEALNGLVPESEMKALCSRHRARHEPYQTPDDFWRLSFPDSHSDDQNSPSPFA